MIEEQDILLDEELEFPEEEFDFEPSQDLQESQQDTAMRQDLALKMLKHVHDNLGHAIELLQSGMIKDAEGRLLNLVTEKSMMIREKEQVMDSVVIEGIFDGVAMIGGDGNIYPIPQNYASKSRLVEGDVLKLTVTEDGKHIYKQIQPVDRRRAVGQLAFDEVQNGHVVVCQEITYNVLPASVSYHRGAVGDEVVVTVPRSGRSSWAALEHVVKHR